MHGMSGTSVLFGTANQTATYVHTNRWLLLQYGELVAIASMQALLGQADASAATRKRAQVLQERVLHLLWHPQLHFLGTYKTQLPPTWQASAGAAQNSRCSHAAGASFPTMAKLGRMLGTTVCLTVF